MKYAHPLVSVIIPSYRHEKYLGKRIESILGQSYQNIEVFILDDHSPDNSRSIIEKYEQHPLVRQVVYNESNSGNTFIQWKKGLGLCQGKYIWIAESDDYCERSLLDSLVSKAESNPNIGLAFCNSYQVDSNDQILKKVNPHDPTFLKKGIDEIVNNLTKRNSIPNASAVIFQRKLITQDILELLPKHLYCGDWFLWVSILCVSDIYYFDQPLNFFRSHSANVSSKAIYDGTKYYEVFQILKFVKNKKLPVDINSTCEYWIDMILTEYRYYKQKHSSPPFMKILIKGSDLTPIFPLLCVKIVILRFLSMIWKK